jgi:predicted alpha/beta-fold hydrolase
MSKEAIPTESELSSSITLELTEHGGHAGFIYGSTPFNEKYWVEKRMSEFFKDRFKPVQY